MQLNTSNRIMSEDRSVHDWYRFVLSFPPHLVKSYLEQFGANSKTCVLDPFCGTGTTLVECKKLGVPCVGIEANPMAYFASSTKVDWTPDPRILRESAAKIAAVANLELLKEGIKDDEDCSTTAARIPFLRTLNPAQEKLILTNSISPLPLHKVLVLLEQIDLSKSRYKNHMRLALANALVSNIGNIRFGPEVGVGKIKRDTPVLAPWCGQIEQFASDLRHLQDSASAGSELYRGDAREISLFLKTKKVRFVFTSPPYPNEKDYTRTTRLESVILGFLSTKQDLRAMKEGLLRSNTRNVFVGDDDANWIRGFTEVEALADAIEQERIKLGKTSGFERLYAKVTRSYFGGMTRHLAELRSVLLPGALLGYVVGDQASYFRIMIRTGDLLAKAAQSLGYEHVRTDLFRTRIATATKEQLREEVLLLRWPG